jgi:hypothetical protein
MIPTGSVERLRKWTADVLDAAVQRIEGPIIAWARCHGFSMISKSTAYNA